MAKGQIIIDSDFLQEEGRICERTASFLENAENGVKQIAAFSSPVYGSASQQKSLNSALMNIISKISALRGSVEELRRCVLGFNNQFLKYSDFNEDVAHTNRDAMRNSSGIAGDEGGGLLVTHIPASSSAPNVTGVVDNTGNNAEAKKTFVDVIKNTVERIFQFFSDIFGKKA